MRGISFLLPAALALVAACSAPDRPPPAGPGSSHQNGANYTQGCIDVFDPEQDYFPAKASLEHAVNFDVEYRKFYKLVTVHQASQGGAAERYVLQQCGAPRPELAGEFAHAAVIAVPVVSLFSGSTTHLPLLSDLQRLDVLTGVADARYIAGDAVRERIRQGKTVEYSPGTLNPEFIISRMPSLVMDSGSSDPGYAAVRAAGIPVVSNAEWLETTALGRAEWLKFLALFLNEEAAAESIFQTVEQRYRATAERVRAVPQDSRVKVMTGGASRGSFAIAGGRSYVASLIRDAGGDYVWADNPDTSFTMIDIEAQIDRAADADVWINGGDWKTLEDMLGDDPRYVRFKPYRTGRIWLYDRRVEAGGANDYWSRGVTRPDLILEDLIKIFYPALGAGHEFEWYRQVPRE